MAVEYSLINDTKTPEIYVTPEADFKMRYYIDNSDKEIGWLGYVEDLGTGIYLITDVFLVKQQVHSATTEILPEGLAEIATTLLSQGEEGQKKYNSIRMWGHSHVNMSPTPSSQDNTQMKDFSQNDYYIRLIGNKEGVWNVSLWDFKNNILWEGLTLKYWFDINVDTKALAQEIKDNVSEIQYKTSATPFYRGFPYQTYKERQKEREYFGDYFEDDYYYGKYPDDYYYRGYQTKEKEKETQEKTVSDIIPYYITGTPSATDIDNIAEYYCSDYNEMLAMVCGTIDDVIKIVGEDWDLILTDSLAKEIQNKIIEKYSNRKGDSDNELQ